MLKRLTAALFLVTASVSTSVAQKGPTPTQLYDWCRSKRGTWQDIYCTAFISGVATGLVIGQKAADERQRFCPPENMTNGQARLIVEKLCGIDPTFLAIQRRCSWLVPFWRRFRASRQIRTLPGNEWYPNLTFYRLEIPSPPTGYQRQ